MDPHDIDLNELEPRVLDWINADPDPKTAAELTDLLARANCDAPDMATGSRDEALLELHDRFAGFLEFGTAGLRGTLGGGPNRMNRAVVIKAAAGLGDYLSEQLREVEDIGVVIGYDARHRSVDFARDTAAVLTAQGKKVFLIDSPVPTPILAYAIRDLAAEAGVMVTASHNPPQDNGYKVYLGGRLTAPEATGVQIVSPADSEIAAAIAKIGPARQVTRAESGWQVLGSEVATAYLASLKDLDAGPGTQQVADQRAGLRIVYTPLHGVGGTLAQAALTQAGFLDVHVVAQQEHPDPDFPTVIFPNPEEPGAMDLALGLAEEVAADIIIANDPDADRCAVAARDSETGEFRMLEGDEVGALLAERIAGDALLAERIAGDALLAKRFAEGASVPPQSASVPAESASAPPKTPPALASSVVS
ncbi:MAG TPA: phospho-sugar mutase, partial [Actinomycetales bacterium]|nr:phospho-sugar mutase [Actinomycetales bacterium]